MRYVNSSITGFVRTSRAMRSTSARAAVQRYPIRKRKRKYLPWRTARHRCKANLAQGVMDGLALGIEDRCLQCDVDMRLHYP